MSDHSDNAIFLRFAFGLLAILALYGAGMMVVVLWGDYKLATRLISGFASMFAGVLGLGVGYLVGARTAPSAGTPPEK